MQNPRITFKFAASNKYSLYNQIMDMEEALKSPQSDVQVRDLDNTLTFHVVLHNRAATHIVVFFHNWIYDNSYDVDNTLLDNGNSYIVRQNANLVARMYKVFKDFRNSNNRLL